jgi:hypothetical protein
LPPLSPTGRRVPAESGSKLPHSKVRCLQVLVQGCSNPPQAIARWSELLLHGESLAREPPRCIHSSAVRTAARQPERGATPQPAGGVAVGVALGCSCNVGVGGALAGPVGDGGAEVDVRVGVLVGVCSREGVVALVGGGVGVSLAVVGELVPVGVDVIVRV